jgi:NTP pyrophosphatase (non-canonical NTP hydrolase)
MLTKAEYLYACLSEECGEVSQVIGKILRFGINDSHPKTGDIPNKQLLKDELNDILAVAKLLGFQPDNKAIGDKQKKVMKYMEYAIAVGKVSNE